MSQYERSYVKDRTWTYIGLMIIYDSDAIENDAKKDYLESLSIDKLTWKTIISSALGKLYGITGEARHFDVLDTRDRFGLIRIVAEDEDIFINSISAHTFSLTRYVGSVDFDIDCRLEIDRVSPFLGLATANPHYDI